MRARDGRMHFACAKRITPSAAATETEEQHEPPPFLPLSLSAAPKIETLTGNYIENCSSLLLPLLLRPKKGVWERVISIKSDTALKCIFSSGQG